MSMKGFDYSGLMPLDMLIEGLDRADRTTLRDRSTLQHLRELESLRGVLTEWSRSRYVPADRRARKAADQRLLYVAERMGP